MISKFFNHTFKYHIVSLVTKKYASEVGALKKFSPNIRVLTPIPSSEDSFWITKFALYGANQQNIYWENIFYASIFVTIYIKHRMKESS